MFAGLAFPGAAAHDFSNAIPDMITTEEALAIIRGSIRATSGVESVPLGQASGRVLAQDAAADSDIPPFDRATVDGYAVVSSDGGGTYPVVEDVPAGAFPKVRVTPGSVSKIMTGAPLPEGADAVVPVEETGGFVGVGEKARINKKIAPGKNVSPKGEDAKTGSVVLRRGAVIRPQEIAVLAAVGISQAPVLRLPSVGVLATGDELVEPPAVPGPGQIRNSNGPSTTAMAGAMGLLPVNLGVARDDEASLQTAIRRGMDFDFLLLSGGVSSGDRDLVPAVLARLGYKILFHKVKIKPGKPTLFGVSPGGGYVFGLPGNPVSGMVIFELFIRPALALFMGAPAGGMEVEARLLTGFKRKNAEREEYLPARIWWEDDGFSAELIEYHGSGHFTALTRANGLVKIPVGVKTASAGRDVTARFLGDRLAPAP